MRRPSLLFCSNSWETSGLFIYLLFSFIVVHPSVLIAIQINFRKVQVCHTNSVERKSVSEQLSCKIKPLPYYPFLTKKVFEDRDLSNILRPFPPTGSTQRTLIGPVMFGPAENSDSRFSRWMLEISDLRLINCALCFPLLGCF